MFGFLINVIDLLSFFNYLDKENKKVTLDELANLMSDHTDEIIIDLMQKESLNFGGGIFEISYDDKKPKKFVIHLKLYFSDQNGEILLKETSKILKITNLDDADGADLKRAERISYSISEPNNG
jgi:hypothetical protein